MNAVVFVSLVGCIWLLLAIMMAFAWSIEQRTGNSGWVDVVWTCAMALSGLTGAAAMSLSGDTSGRQLLVCALVTVWAVRLASHIAWRTARVADDPRYRKLREQWGASARRNMFLLLQAQALLSVPMSTSIVLAAWNPAGLFSSIMDWLAIICFTAGFAGSGMADFQLARFKGQRRESGRVCDVGLWAWSRHPNYFFELLIWIGFALFAIDSAGASTWGYAAVAGPVCMYWLLRYVSGVPPLEQHMLEKYGAAYARYQQATSVFFPLPPDATDK